MIFCFKEQTQNAKLRLNLCARTSIKLSAHLIVLPNLHKTPMKSLRRLYAWLIAFNSIAVGLSAFLLYLHFKPDLTGFCNLAAKFDCDIVNKSIYSEIFGVPVALLGLIAYIIITVFAIRGLYKDQKKLLPYMTAFVSAGFLFALYLTGVETFILRTYCIFCVMQQVIIFVDLSLLLYSRKLSRATK